MKTTLSFVAALTILGVAALPLGAQTQSPTSTSTTNYIQTSKLIGTKVKASSGDEVGEIKDVVLDQNGCMAYTVVSTSGGGGGGGSRTTSTSTSTKTVAVPWSVYSTTSDPRVMTVRVERDRIYNAPAFEYSRINEYATGGYINNVNSYFGVSASVGVNGAVNGGRNEGVNRTETGVNTSANTPNPSPGSSAAASLPTATPATSATPSASPSITPVGTATPTPSRHTNKEDKPKSTLTPASPRHRTEPMNDSDSTSETSPSKKKSSEASSESSPSSKKAHRRGTEGTESSPTPKDEPERE